MSSSSALCSCLSSGSSVTSTHRRRRASSSSSLTSSSSSSSFPSSRRGFSPPSVYLNKNKNNNNINNNNNNTSSGSSGRRRSSSSSSKLKVCAAMSSIDDPNFADLSDRLKLDNVRQSLIRQEDSIIFALIERSQYKVNDKIYKTNSIDVPCYDAKTGVRSSMIEFMLREREQMDGKIRRYTSPDEHAFYPESLPPLVIPPMNFGEVLHECALKININDRIKEMYVENIVPGMCESGDDNNYGSAGLCDVNCLQLISRRIHYGKFVAEAKFRAQPDEYSDLIRKQDGNGLMQLLTNQAVEDRVVARVTNKAAFYGQDINEEVPDASKVLTNPENQKYKVAPEIIADLYFKWIMPMTKDVQVEYLLQRLD